MIYLLSSVLILIFLLLSAIHVYWAFGGKWGVDVAIPSIEGDKKVFTPGLSATLFVATALFCFAAITYYSVFHTDINVSNALKWAIDKGLWFIAGIFLLRVIGEFKYVGLFKQIKNTQFAKADTKIFIPLCLTISFLALIIKLIN